MIYLIDKNQLKNANLVINTETDNGRIQTFKRLGSRALEKIYDEIVLQNPEELVLDILFRDFQNDILYIQKLINNCNVNFSIDDFHARMIYLYHNFYSFYTDAYPSLMLKLNKIECENIKELVEYIRLSNKLGFGITPLAKDTCDKYNNAKKNMQVLRLAKQINDLK